jgi:hypothetical protein
LGLRDRFKKTGGGFLNNIAALIVGLEFTTTPPSKAGSAPSAPKGNFTPLFAKVTVKADGAETTEETHLFAGSADDFELDGAVLTPTKADASPWGGTAFSRFYNSICEHGEEAGFEDPAVEDGEPLDFSHVIGVRAMLVQVKDEEGMARAAKKYKTSKGKINELGQRKGNDGKFYDLRTPEVSAVYSIGNDVDAAPAATTTRKAAPAASKKAAPVAAKGKAAAPKADDGAAIRDFAKNVVIEVLEAAKDNKVVRTSLSTGIIKRFNQDDLKGDGRRDDVRKVAVDEAFIGEMVEEGLITFEKNVLALAA